MFVSLIALLSAFSYAPAEASPRYVDCLTLIEADLELGRRAAQQWASEGGGAPAQHCLALADLAAGFSKLSAARLEDLANRDDAGDELVRARILAQAGEAWVRAGETRQAERALDAAFALAPEAGELHLTAARIYAEDEEWQRVERAVTAAEESGFVSSDAYVLRGRAFAALGDFRAAADDVVNALTLDPVNIDALTLRGEIQQTGINIEVLYGAPADEERDAAAN